MINPDPWSEWKAGKTTGESNAWTQCQNENPVKVTDLSDSGVDPLSAIAGGALATLIGKGIGAAIGAAFADGGLVGLPKTERQAKAVRQKRQKLTATKEAIRLAEGGSVIDQDAGDQALAALVVAVHARELLSPEQAKDPEAIKIAVETLLQNSTEEEQRQWVVDFLDAVDPAADGGSIAAILAQILGGTQPQQTSPAGPSEVAPPLPDLTQVPKWRDVAVSDEYRSLPDEDKLQLKGAYFDDWLAPHVENDGEDVAQVRTDFMAQSDTPQSEKPGVHLAGGGFLGGNLGIALGEGVNQWNAQRLLKNQESWQDLQTKLAQPELETIADKTAAKRSNYQLENARNTAEASMVGDKASNARLKLANDSASQETEAYGRLGQYKDDQTGAIGYLNKSGLSQLGGGTVSGVAFDNKGANVSMSDGRSVLIPQTQMDRGAQTMNGKYDFMSNRVTGDIYRTNEKTGSIEPVARTEGTGNRPLSVAQDTTNRQIEISRQKIAGMSPDEIRRRTSKATDTGRENLDYDPNLAQHVRLANKRMYGTDSWYDQQGSSQNASQAQTTGQQDIGTKFANDPNPLFKGGRLGSKTPKGYEVFDASGKQIGWYD
ncbi:MAG: hypothetical protein ACOYBQ_08495 [Fluviibacter sp.]